MQLNNLKYLNMFQVIIGDNMRDPARIDNILSTIKKVWDKAPDLRLCQLIGNCFDSGDLYHVDDDRLMVALANTYPELVSDTIKNIRPGKGIRKARKKKS